MGTLAAIWSTWMDAPRRWRAALRSLVMPWRDSLEASRMDVASFRQRVTLIERNIGLPVRVALLVFLLYALFLTNWLESDLQPRSDAVAILRRYFVMYMAVSVGAGFLYFGMRDLTARGLERLVYTLAILDAAMLALLVVVTGGYDSLIYWLFLGLVIRNAAVIPHADVQLMVNITVSGAYVLGGYLGELLDLQEFELTLSIGRGSVERLLPEAAAEPLVIRALLLLMMAVCCFGLQVLLDRQKTAEAEATEFSARQAQLETAGRLAAEIAHQLKNPLSIIQNAAWSIHRSLGDSHPSAQQLEIIREEVRRSDRIITELMGYASLAEGKVERVEVSEALDRAAELAVPAGAGFDIRVHRSYAMGLPALAVQRAHVLEIFTNILANARDAMGGRGEIFLRTSAGADQSVIVGIRDTGPGIASDIREKVFEPYFTTKEKGTGLGLAIVKHNTELYGGTVRIESEPGMGAMFVIQLPARSLHRLTA